MFGVDLNAALIRLCADVVGFLLAAIVALLIWSYWPEIVLAPLKLISRSLKPETNNEKKEDK